MSFRGQAAFTWTDTDDTMTQRCLLLREPVRELRPAHAQSVFPVDSLDFQTHQVFTVGEGVDELVVHVRFGDDPQGLVDLLKAGTKNRTLTYVPNLQDPTVSYPCVLISPLSPLALGLDPASGLPWGDQEVELRLRQTSKQPFAGVFGNPVLFSYRAGGRIEEATFSRASVGSYAANSHAQGTLTTAASGAARLHWMSTASSVGPRSFPTLLLEDARTNRVLQSENFASVTWTKTSLTATSGKVDPRGGTNGYLLIDASTTVNGNLNQLITMTLSTRATASVFLGPGTSQSTGGTQFFMRSTGGATTHFRAKVTWSSGFPSFSIVNRGTIVQSPVRWRNGYYRFAVRTTGNLSTGNVRISVSPTNAVAEKGNVYAFGVQVEQ